MSFKAPFSSFYKPGSRLQVLRILSIVLKQVDAFDRFLSQVCGHQKSKMLNSKRRNIG